MKILYVTTIGTTMGFFPSFIKKLLDEGHTVDIATNETDSKVPECYREWGCKVYPLSCTRSPFDFGNIRAIKEIKKLVEAEKYDIVHCHTPIAAACTRLACIKSRKNGTKVFYTAHGFHFYKGASVKNWLVYYPVEWICSFFTDVLITINKEDYELAKKRMHAKSVEYVPGVGVDTEKFADTTVNRSEKRKEIGVPEDALLLVSVGELNANKNHEIIICAMAELNDPKIHYIIAGTGSLDGYLKNLAEKLNLSERVHLLGYRKDVAELYKVSDVFCFPSYREGLSVSVMEAMASGLPVVCSRIRGNVDMVDEDGGAFFDPSSVKEGKKAIEKVVNSDVKAMGRYNSEKVKMFELDKVCEIMKDIYKGC